jgi:Uma2 family endonuclease
MGNLATPETLLHRWQEMQRDASLQDLPYKIELNSWGKLEMSPASVRHGQQQAALAEAFRQQLPHGATITECPVLTDIGIRVPALAWGSADFMRQHAGMSPLPRGPEICVEVISPSNVAAEITEKTRAYLAAGAQEVWLASEDGKIRFIDRTGEKPGSAFPISVSLPDLTKSYP